VVNDAKGLLADGAVSRIAGIPKISDLQRYVDKGFLALCNVNLGVLFGLPSPDMHWVLVSDCPAGAVHFISPSEEKTTGRHATHQQFEAIWSHPTPRARSILAIRNR